MYPSRAQARDGEIPAQAHVAFQVDAQRQDGVDFCLDQFARQTKDGNADGEHAAGLGIGLEDGDLVADLDEVVRHGEAGDACADNRDFFIVAAIGRQHALVAACVVEWRGRRFPGRICR